MSSSTKTLPASGPLESLREGDRELLSSFGAFETAKQGKILIQQGKPHGVLIFTMSGSFVAKRAKAGKSEVIGSIRPGEWIGEINLFDPSSAVCSVEAVETSDYWIITRDDFEKFINKHHAAGSVLLIGLAMTLGKRVRELSEKQAASPKVKKTSPVSMVYVAIATTAIVAVASWMISASRLADLEKRSNIRIEEAERSLNESLSKSKTLEAEVVHLKGELEWITGDFERKTSKPQTFATPKPVDSTASTQEESEDSAPTPAAPSKPIPAPEQAAAPADHDKAKTGGLEYPPEIILNKDTTVPVSVGGKVSGSVKIPTGKTFKVLGVDNADVLVSLGSSTVRIPKANTNFQEALDAANLAAEKEAKRIAATRVAAPKPSPSPTPTPKKAETKVTEEQSVVGTPLEQIERIMEMITPLKLLEDMRELQQPGKEHGKPAFMRTHARTFEKAAELAKESLLSQDLDNASRKWFRDVILTSELFENERFDNIRAKLQELDTSWLNLKTDFKIYGPNGAPKSE